MRLPGATMWAGRTRRRWLPRARVRGRTLAGGIALGATILLAMTLVHGLGRFEEAPAPPEADAAHPGPRTALQPELRSALLTDREVAAGRAGDPAAAPPTGAPLPPRGAAPVPAQQAPPDAAQCRALFEDPDGLPARWAATAPKETTSRHTRHRDDAVLHQVLSVFDPDDAPTAYQRMRDTAAGCEEFPATLDGQPVTVLLRELSPTERADEGPAGGRAESGGAESDRWTPPRRPGDRRESAPVTADDTYAMALTVRGGDGTRTGWLTLDRVGPVVSVLHDLGRDGAPPADRAETRRAALRKLHTLLRLLHRLESHDRGDTPDGPWTTGKLPATEGHPATGNVPATAGAGNDADDDRRERGSTGPP